MSSSLIGRGLEHHTSRRSFLKLATTFGVFSTLNLALGACGQDSPAATVTPSAPPAPSAEPARAGLSDVDIRAILQRRIDQEKLSVGIVVGLIGPQGRRVVSHGTLDKQRQQPVAGETMFEIGSITKVYTATLLSIMLEQQALGLDDPIAGFLPTDVSVPSRNGDQITLRHLVTHTSGLPSMPSHFEPADPLNPYADYTVEQMYAFLSDYTLSRDIGSQYEYSNLGVGLLGHILALKAGIDYETLVKTRICAPLGLNDTSISLSPEQQARLATGHDIALRPSKNWDLPTLAGAGALRSTANDQLSFLAANLGLTATDLLPALRTTHQPLHTIQAGVAEIGMGWHTDKQFGSTIIWHNGQTGGYHSFIGLDSARQSGVVVFSNSAHPIEDIGFHLLDPQYALELFEPRTERTVITLEPTIYQQYVGEYQLAPDFVLTVSAEGSSLMVQATGQSQLEVYPESETTFFYTAVDAQITFVKDDAGQVTSLILHQNGQNMPAQRVKK